MKVLIVTANFRAEGVNPWLLDDLSSELVRSGHRVDVLVHSPTAPRPRGQQEIGGATVLSVGAERAPRTSVGKLVSYLATAARVHTVGWRWLARNHYDLCIYPSIGAFSFGLPARLRRRGAVSTLLFVMWDFFPVHQLDIGRIRAGALSGALKRIERAAIQRADVIATMSPANERFLRAYHRDLRARSVTIPPWAADEPGAPVPKRERFSVIFGGQLARGRGVDTLVDAAVLLLAAGADVDVIIAGSGPDEDHLRAYAAEQGASNVEFTGGLPREQYRTMLRSCHVGVAVTVAGVTPPSFPSKIVEYCANGVPSIVSVEESSDAGELVEAHGAGLAVRAGSPQSIADAITSLATEHRDGILEARAARARALFDEELSVRIAAERMTREAGAPPI